MSDWREKLEDIDDDYLIGISNKGIVKRAYKDRQETVAEILSLDDEAAVKVGEETVTVRFPLGESTCTCPSRSVCRHVIQAILTLREGVTEEKKTAPGAKYAPPELPAKESAAAQGERCVPPGLPAEEGASSWGERSVLPGLPAGEEHLTQDERNAQREAIWSETGLQKDTVVRTKAIPHPAASDRVCREIDEYPLTVLRKNLGGRQIRNFVSQVISGVRAQIQYASVVSVRLPGRESGTETVVKLLSPLEYSACTCHKKEMCVHKAAAILWCKLDSGVLTGEELADWASEELSYDMDRVRDAAGQMKLFLEELLGTGLSRTSPDVLDHMERLAVISHNAGLARFESYFRGLSDSYDGYFKRRAAFKTEDLMAQITRLYRRTGLLLQAEDNTEVRRYAGEFRAEYIPVGRLNLICIGLEHFNSRTGYEGETVYFLEENTKKWYTYTNARPVFYETGKKRNISEKAQAPWGLGISMEELVKVRISLTGAKSDERRRLSSSQDTKGEITGQRNLSLSDIEGWYYRDFGKLFSEQFGKRQKEWLAEESSREAPELVFVQPASCEPAKFSQTGQQLSLPLYDEEGREITIEVAYSKEEAAAIRYLEKISEDKLPCFAGKLYLKDGRLRMYPVALQNAFFEPDSKDALL